MKSAKIPQKILIAVVAVLFFVCGSVVTYFLILLDSNASAFNSTYTETDNAVVVSELWNGGKTSGSFTGANVKTLIQMLSNSTSGTIDTIGANIDSTTPNNQSIKMINATDLRGYSEAGKVSGKSIVVTLGGYRWIVTCLSKDTSGNIVATLWLDDALSTTSTFGDTTSYYGANDVANGYPTAMYGTSYIRSVTLNNGGRYIEITTNSANPTSVSGNYTSTIDHAFGAFTATAGALVPYIVQPNNMPYQTVSQGANNSGMGYVLMNESLATSLTEYNSTYTFQSKDGYTAWGSDCLWLPSIAETGYSTSVQGIWQTSVAERSNSVSYSWSRSCHPTSSRDICILYLSGTTNSSVTVNHSFAVRPALHLNLTAIVNCVTEIVTLDSVGGSGGTSLVQTWVGDTMPSITAPTKTGYTFGGYFTSINGTGEQYYSVSGEGLKRFSATSPKTLYAKWTANSYTVTFEYNGATSGNSLASKTVTYNSLYSDLPQPTKSGAVFGGWYLESTFVNAVTSTTVVSTADNHTIYAKWSTWLQITASGADTSVSCISEINALYTKASALIEPSAGLYVSAISFDNANWIGIEYYDYTIHDLDFGIYASYHASTNTNRLGIDFEYVDPSYFDTVGAIKLYLTLSSTAYTSLRAQGSGSVEGAVLVTSTVGGSVTIIGNDYENMADSDTITFKADVVLDGYYFVGWFDINNSSSPLSTEESVKLQKSVVYERVIVARFEPITTSDKVNDSTSN